MSKAEVKKEFSGGLLGNYPPYKYDDHLSEQKEIEEYINEDKSEKCDDSALEKYFKKKGEYIKKILIELEEFTGCPRDKWTGNEEGMIWDMMDAIEHETKAILSQNNPKYEG